MCSESILPFHKNIAFSFYNELIYLNQSNNFAPFLIFNFYINLIRRFDWIKLLILIHEKLWIFELLNDINF